MNNKIKNLLVSVALVATGVFASQALAAVPVVDVGDRIKFADGPGASPGGAFLITDFNSTGAVVKGSFESFCVEYNEHMNYTDFFRVSDISKEARNGGVGGGSPDPLDVRTAWLYTQYMETPSVLDSVGTWSTASAVDRGTAMQKAIWFIENEITSVTGLASALVAEAAGKWTDTGRVYILNVTTLSGGVAQDQLYIAPIPEPEVYAMLVAGLGLMGFVARRRKSHNV